MGNTNKKNKKKKLSLTIDEKLLDIFDEYLEEINISNQSRYIQKLIREDMEKRGKDVSIDF